MSRSRLWWQVHHWAGLKLTLLLSFVLLTGTIAVIAHEIDWLLRPALRVDPATVTASDVNWQAIARTLADREPQSSLVNLAAPLDPWFAAVAVVRGPIAASERRTRFVYLHPTTGAYRGDGHWVGAQRVLRNLHRHLMLPTRYGVPLVSSLALVLLATWVTSLVIYKHWWRGFLKPVRLERPRRAWGDVHRLAGVWSLPFLLLMALTGLWYLVESLGGRAPGIGPPPTPGGEISTREAATLLPCILAAAHRAFPGLRIKRIVFPSASESDFRIEGQYRAVLVRERANAIWVEPRTGEVRAVVDGRSLDLHQRISEMADPLHFGNFAGWPTKVAWLLFGLLLTALTMSGAAVYALRIAAACGRSDRPVAVLRIWHGMGWLRWPCATLIVAGFALLPTLLRE